MKIKEKENEQKNFRAILSVRNMFFLLFLFIHKTLHPADIYYVQIIKKSLVKSEKSHFFYFFLVILECDISRALIGQQGIKKGKHVSNKKNRKNEEKSLQK